MKPYSRKENPQLLNQKNYIIFLWVNATPKIKHNILCNYCKNGEYKNPEYPEKNYNSSVFIDKKIIC